jgi:transposase
VPSADEIKLIIELWNQGKSYGEVAKHFEGKKSTVQGWIESLIKKGKIEPRTNGVRTNTKNATNAHITFTREKRLALNDKFLKIINDKIDKDDISPGDLKALATTYGIMVDKREILEPPVPLKVEDDGFFSELECKAEEVWQDAQDIPIQVDATKPQAMANSDLVDKSITDTEA